MKIHISHDPNERREAEEVVAALLPKLPHVRIHQNEDKAGKNHIYLTTRKPEKS